MESVVTTAAEDKDDNTTRGFTFPQRLGWMSKVSLIDRRENGQSSLTLKFFDFSNPLNSARRCLHHETIYNSKRKSFHCITTQSFCERQQSLSDPSKSLAAGIKHSLETLPNFLVSIYFFANLLMIALRWERSRGLKRFGRNSGDPASLSIESFSSKIYGILFILLSFSTTGSCVVTVLSSEHTRINPSCTTNKQSLTLISFMSSNSVGYTNVNQPSTSNFSGVLLTVVRRRTAIMLSKSSSLRQEESDASHGATTDRADLTVINSKTSITSSSSYLADHVMRSPPPSYYYHLPAHDNSSRKIYPTMSSFTIRNGTTHFSHSMDESKATTQIPETNSRNVIVSVVSPSRSLTLASVVNSPSSNFTRMNASSPAFVASSSQGLLNTTALSSVSQIVSFSAKLSLSIFSLPSLSPTTSPQESRKLPLKTIQSSLHSSLMSSLSSVLTEAATLSLRPSLLASMPSPSISVSSSSSPGSSSFLTSQFSISQSSPSLSRNALSPVTIISSMSSVLPAETVTLHTTPDVSETLILLSAIPSQQHYTPRPVSYGRSETIFLSPRTIQNDMVSMSSAKIFQQAQNNSASFSIITHQPIVPDETRILMLNFSLMNEVFHSDLLNESSMRRMNLSQRVNFTVCMS